MEGHEKKISSEKATRKINPASRYTIGIGDGNVKTRQMPKNHKLVVVGALIAAAVLLVASIIVIVVLLNHSERDSDVFGETDKVIQVDTGDNEINLSEHTKSIRITEAGEYTLRGTMNDHSVIVDTDSDVTLVLAGVTINSKDTAAIVSLGEHDLFLALADDTTNTLTDSGSSKYDAALYASGSLIINGQNGVLNIVEQQEKGGGISAKSHDLVIDGGVINIKSVGDGLVGGTVTINDGTVSIMAENNGIKGDEDAFFNGGSTSITKTGVNKESTDFSLEKGYSIHNGIVVALGDANTLEAPKDNSTQYSIALLLPTTYSAGANIVMTDSSGNVLINHTAGADFRTLILSNEQIHEGSYVLSINGQAVQTVDVSSIVTVVGEVNVDNNAEDDSASQ